MSAVAVELELTRHMVKMAGSGDHFDDLNRLFSNLGFNGNKDADKKKRSIDSNNGGRRSGGGGEEEWSIGEKVAVGAGVGLALGASVAGIAAISYLCKRSDNKTKPSESRNVPSRGFGSLGGLETQGFFPPGLSTGRESRRYGYFRCNNCRHNWESAYTFSKGQKAVSSFFMT